MRMHLKTSFLQTETEYSSDIKNCNVFKTVINFGSSTSEDTNALFPINSRK